MRKSRFVTPYIEAGKTRFPELRRQSGVYLIKENNNLLYVGFSGTQLYKTLYRHFQHWQSKYQKVVSYNPFGPNRYTVRVILMPPAKAERIHKLLICKYHPEDNETKYTEFCLEPHEKEEVDEVEALPAETENDFENPF